MSDTPSTERTTSPGYRIGGLDSVDACRLRLMTLRTRINDNWPKSGGILRRAARPDRSDPLGRLLVALPTPLPIHRGQAPEPILPAGGDDLRLAAGRAVDAAMALLEADSLDAQYAGRVSMMAGIGASGPVTDIDPIEVDDPTVGLLVATIIGTLEAVSEYLIPYAGRRDVGR